MLKIPDKTRRSIFLFGPRGTGKTHWLKAHFPKAVYLDLLDAQTYLDLSQDPGLLDRKIPEGFEGWVIIDEVQRVPTLLHEVHRLIEGRDLRFILTGSSARTLKRKGVDLLAGRMITHRMHPLTGKNWESISTWPSLCATATYPRSIATMRRRPI